MKRIILLLTILFGIQAIGYNQIKMWEANKIHRPVKAKGGFFSELTQENPAIEENQKGFFAASTVVGALLPYAIKYGNYAFKKITGKDEKEYTAECVYSNALIIDSNSSFPKTINSTQYFYKKGESITTVASLYSFIISKNDQNELNIDLDQNYTETYIPIRTKRKYDLVITTFTISLKALIEEKDAGKVTYKLIDLTTQTLFKIDPSYNSKSDKIKILKQGVYIKPASSSLINKYIITCSIKYVNPYGVTSSILNSFLNDNSDTNEQLLNDLLIKQ